MFGRLGSLKHLGGLGASGASSASIDEAVTISQVAAVSAGVNATAIVGFSQVAGVSIETDPAAEFSAIATVTASGLAAYKGAPAISNIASVTASGIAGRVAAPAISNIAGVSIERTVGYSWTNTEGETFETNADTTSWDDTFRGHLDQLFSDLKSGQINATNTLAELDFLFAIAQPNSASAYRSLINPATHTATAVNSPTFLANRHVAGNGSTSYLNLNWDPSTDGSNFTQNDASFAVWVRTSAASGGYWLGSAAGINIIGKNSSGKYNFFGPNSAASTGATGQGSAGTTGLFLANRTGASAVAAYIGTTESATDTDASTALASDDWYACGYNDGGALTQPLTDQIAFLAAGGSMTANQIADFEDALSRFQTAREAI